MRLRSAVIVGLLACVACGDDDAMGPRDGGPPPLPSASLGHIVAFEGHQTFVNDLVVEDGGSLLGATIVPEPGTPIEIVEQQCVADRCGFVARVLDTRNNRGVGVPSPIDAQNHFLIVQRGGVDAYRALVTVNPVDELTGRGTEPARVGQAIFLATSVTSDVGSQFIAATDDPVRWVSFGDVRLEGDFLLNDSLGLAGGGLGGDPQSDAPGSFGGGGSTEGGGGGGGHLEVGSPGQLAGEPDAGGSGGAARTEAPGACLADFARTDCGGGGGGGGRVGAGGRGAGSILIASLGDVVLSGNILGAGDDGVDDGGAGAGGAVFLSGRTVALNTRPTLAGGTVSDGPVPGGVGSPGVLRLDSPEAVTGVFADPASVPRLTSDARVELSGQTLPDTIVEIERDGAVVGSATSDGTGAFAVSVDLAAGLNRLAVFANTDAGRIRSWTGTSFEFLRVGDARQALPVGALTDVVYLP